MAISTGYTPTPADVDQLLSETEAWLRSVNQAAASLPSPEGELNPATVQGGALFLNGAMFATTWLLSSQATTAALRADVNAVLELLVPMTASQVDELRRRVAILQRDLLAARTAAASQAALARTVDVMPSPAAVNRASGAELSNAVARLALWQRVHHREVHEGLVVAASRESGATVAAVAATAGAVTETVKAVRQVVEVTIPDAVHDLTVTIRALRQAQQAANAALERELTREARELAQRIGDLVRWLRTEALPELDEAIRAEKQVRQQAMAAVRRALQDEVQAREATDLDLMTQLAPLVAMAAAGGIHTVQKVQTYESAINRLGQLDPSLLLSLTSWPGLTALVGFVAGNIVGQVPAIMGSLDRAAAEALGVIR